MHLLWRHIGLITLIYLVMTPSVFSQTEDIPAFELKPPAKPQCDVWVEGESFVSSSPSGWEVREEASCYAGKQAVLATKEGKEHVVEYKVSIPADGFYLLSVAGQPLGRGYTSPIWVSVDSGEWKQITAAPVSQVAWGIAGAVNWTNLLLLELKTGDHQIAFKVDQPRLDGQFAYMIDAIALIRNPYTSLNLPPKLVTDRPGNVFTTNQPTVFRIKSPGDYGRIVWQVEDWRGKTYRKGIWKDTNKPLVIPGKDLGYYRLRIRTERSDTWTGTFSFVRVVDPAGRVRNPDSPYAMDSAQTWHAADRRNPFVPPNVQEYLAELEELAGLTMVRDRTPWIENSPGQYQWLFDSTVEILFKRGVKVCGVYHDAPGWTYPGREEDSFGGLPHDLLAVYRYCRESGKRYAGKVTAWEFWNEPDAAGKPPWYYTAALKAAYLGYKAADPEIKVLNGSTCLHPVPRFMDILMENGAGDYFDIYNCHVYSLQCIRSAMAYEKAFLKRHHAQDKPIWVTENGLLIGGAREPLAPGTDFYEHDENQELEQADYWVKSQVLFQSEGAAKDFTFILPPYNECGSGRVWGALRWDYTAKPAYCAFANLTAQLSNAQYLGTRNEAEVETFVYLQPDGKRTLVYWSKEKDNVTFQITDRAASLRVVDIMGQQKQITPKGGAYTLHADRYPTYVNGWVGLKPTNSYRKAKTTKSVSSRKDQSVVLQIDLKNGFDIARNKAMVTCGQPCRAVLDVYNFSDHIKEGSLNNLGKGYDINGLPENISIPAMGKVTLTLDITFHKEYPGLVKLRIGGEFNSKPIWPVVVPVHRRDMAVSSNWSRVGLPVEDAARWQKNSSGAMEIVTDGKEKGIGFKVEYPPSVDQWIYPEFRLNLPSESMKNAVVIRFDIKASHLAGGYVMACYEGIHERGQSSWFPFILTTDWSTVTILFEEDAPVSFDPADVLMLRLGANPSARQFEYKIRNFEIFYRK